MSYRINRAIGYGMEWNKFEELALFEGEAHETADWLDDVMSSATKDDLTVPMEFRNELFYGKARPRRPIIMDPELLATTLEFKTVDHPDGTTSYERIKADYAPASSLYRTVHVPDETLAVIFFPTARYAKDWYRFDDMLDYQFEAFREGTSECQGPRDFLIWPKFGHHPFSNALMDLTTGEPLLWEPFSGLDEVYPKGWAPDVPSEIRWWTKKLGIFDENGVNQLRPVVAQWWA